MRGFKRDNFETRLAYAAGHFRDKKKRSFISLPKASEHGTVAHQIVRGDDVGPLREAIFKRDGGLCQLRLSKWCLVRMSFEGDWHLEHRVGGDADRCWCAVNLRVSCAPCHIIKTNREPRWEKARC